MQANLYREDDVRNGDDVNNFVEIKGPSGWGILCFNTTFDFDAGNAVCRETNEKFAYRVRSGVARRYTGVYYKGSVACSRDAMTARECNLQLTTSGDCAEGHIIVDCSTGLSKEKSAFNVIFI